MTFQRANDLPGQGTKTDLERELLAQFSDIHLPETIGWWPLSWQLWLVLFLLLSLFIFSLLPFFRKSKGRRYDNIVLKELENIQRHCHELGINHSYQKINEVVKRSFLANGTPLREISALHGNEWLAYLFNRLPQNKQKELEKTKAFFSRWVNETYQNPASDVHHVLEYIDYVKQVIRHQTTYRGAGDV